MVNEVIELPELKDEYAVSALQINQYEKNGHILLRQVCSPEEIAAYHPIIGSATGRFNTETRALDQRDTYGKAFLQVMNLWQRDAAARKFVLATRFGKIAADLMGVDAVRLYHDQALYKEAGGGPTPWHQDQFYWPLESAKTITMWMPLVDVPIERGALTFASGSHTKGNICPNEISDESDKLIDQIVTDNGFPLAVESMKAGDATFHSGWTLHKAPGNQTQGLREVMTIIFFADGTRCSKPDSRFQEADLAAWLPGCRPGDLAASELNPVVFARC
jgi:ectoine hydroxylase-related dioxygenase (phytanoyl-CoA dioxygenase family)